MDERGYEAKVPRSIRGKSRRVLTHKQLDPLYHQHHLISRIIHPVGSLAGSPQAILPDAARTSSFPSSQTSSLYGSQLLFCITPARVCKWKHLIRNIEYYVHTTRRRSKVVSQG